MKTNFNIRFQFMLIPGSWWLVCIIECT